MHARTLLDLRVPTLIAGLAAASAAQDIQLESSRTRFRTSAEILEVSGSDIGLVGVHYDWLEPFEDLSDFYFGVGGYVSVSGHRGGFQAAGFTAGYSKEFVPDFLLDAGVFLGGAGGSGRFAPHPGLAVRPFIGLERAFGVLGVRLEVAAMDIAQTDIEIEDVHVSLGLTSASEILFARERYLDEELPAKALVERTTRTSLRYSRFDPGEGARRRNGQPFTSDVHLLGLGYDYFIGENLFVPFQLHGAVGGDVAGFSTALLGIGGSYPLDREGHFRLEGTLSAGAGGGGGLDTGGGFLVEVKGGIQAAITPNLGLEVSAGYLDFIDGHLDGPQYSAAVTWTTHPLELALDQPRSSLDTLGLSSGDAEIRPIRVFAQNKIYMPPRSALDQSGDPISTANLMGITLEQPLFQDFSVTAGLYTAWSGSIGGYSEGLVGIAYEYFLPENKDHSFLLRAETGAAGGGGVDVGSGLVYTATAGYRYHISERFFAQAEIGKLEADRGSFEAESWQLGFGMNLGRVYRR